LTATIRSGLCLPSFVDAPHPTIRDNSRDLHAANILAQERIRSGFGGTDPKGERQAF
jgi:hypothetical protein